MGIAVLACLLAAGGCTWEWPAGIECHPGQAEPCTASGDRPGERFCGPDETFGECWASSELDGPEVVGLEQDSGMDTSVLDVLPSGTGDGSSLVCIRYPTADPVVEQTEHGPHRSVDLDCTLGVPVSMFCPDLKEILYSCHRMMPPCFPEDPARASCGSGRR